MFHHHFLVPKTIRLRRRLREFGKAPEYVEDAEHGIHRTLRPSDCRVGRGILHCRELLKLWWMGQRNPAPVDGLFMFIPLFIGLQPAFWWCRIPQPSTVWLVSIICIHRNYQILLAEHGWTIGKSLLRWVNIAFWLPTLSHSPSTERHRHEKSGSSHPWKLLGKEDVLWAVFEYSETVDLFHDSTNDPRRKIQQCLY